MRPWNVPPAVNPRDPWVVINTRTGVSVESHFLQESAVHAALVLNDHEIRWGRPPVYDVQSQAFDKPKA